MTVLFVEPNQDYASAVADYMRENKNLEVTVVDNRESALEEMASRVNGDRFNFVITREGYFSITREITEKYRGVTVFHHDFYGIGEGEEDPAKIVDAFDYQKYIKKASIEDLASMSLITGELSIY